MTVKKTGFRGTIFVLLGYSWVPLGLFLCYAGIFALHYVALFREFCFSSLILGLFLGHSWVFQAFPTV